MCSLSYYFIYRSSRFYILLVPYFNLFSNIFCISSLHNVISCYAISQHHHFSYPALLSIFNIDLFLQHVLYSSQQLQIHVVPSFSSYQHFSWTVVFRCYSSLLRFVCFHHFVFFYSSLLCFVCIHHFVLFDSKFVNVAN